LPDRWQQGLIATCTDPSNEAKAEEEGSQTGLAHESVGAMTEEPHLDCFRIIDNPGVIAPSLTPKLPKPVLSSILLLTHWLLKCSFSKGKLTWRSPCLLLPM
ncbi:MAG: hypothetical protein WBA08_18450, partial [Candidatus Sulfotelmatobacter sp.]